jgi:epoxyqueuosine reductase
MKLFTAELKAAALRAGFSACGAAPATPLDGDVRRHFDDWLQAGFHAKMHYMENHRELRFNPAKMMDGAKSVFMVACNYYSTQRQTDGAPVISKYAYGRDYHLVVREKLNSLIELVRQRQPEAHCRAFVDSAPVAEKVWAQRCGIGWMGKNSNIIIDRQGAFHFLGGLLLDIELEYDSPTVASKCGDCTRCIDNCPAAAIVSPYVIDARKCIACLTVEFKGDFTGAPQLANRLFGCDICQDVCPHNLRFAKPNNEPLFAPSPQLLNKTRDEWRNIDETEFKTLFSKSAVKRAKLAGLRRNLSAILHLAIILSSCNFMVLCETSCNYFQ